MIKEYLIILFLIALILALICLLYATGILKRKVLITTVENLPIGIFKDDNKEIQEKILDIHIQKDSECDEIITADSKSNLEKHFTGEAIEIIQRNNMLEKDIVYWTPQGKNYHKIQNCGALLRSKIVNHGSINESGKSTGCNKCCKS